MTNDSALRRVMRLAEDVDLSRQRQQHAVRLRYRITTVLDRRIDRCVADRWRADTPGLARLVFIVRLCQE